MSPRPETPFGHVRVKDHTFQGWQCSPASMLMVMVVSFLSSMLSGSRSDRNNWQLRAAQNHNHESVEGQQHGASKGSNRELIGSRKPEERKHTTSVMPYPKLQSLDKTNARKGQRGPGSRELLFLPSPT